MINSLLKSLEIDTIYSVNSFIYVLRKLPIFKDLFTDDIYKSKYLKKIIGLFGVLLSISKVFFIKVVYFSIIYYIATKLSNNNITIVYTHVYIILTLIGLFINNTLLSTSKKKYFSLILFNMNDNSFLKSTLIYNSIVTFVLNGICFILLNSNLNYNLIDILLLLVFNIFIRYIGEYLNILFYRKYKYIWYSNTTYYFILLFIGLLLILLPLIGIIINNSIFILLVIISILLGFISLIYLFKINDYKRIYKKINQMTDVMNSKNEKDYFKQAMVEVKDKDKIINSKKLEGKTGYDLFNTIFFERHKEILLRSAKKYSIVLLLIYIVLIYYVLNDKSVYKQVFSIFNNHLSWFILIMYFINRGAIVTQAMFYNCDHAMLKYNFYRETDNLLGLFKRRLVTLIKINLLPAVVISIGNTILYFIFNFNIFNNIISVLFILSLSIFYSTHYLVIYYLNQPYNKDMEMTKISYTVISLITYVLAFMLTGFICNTLVLSISGIIITFIYIIISLYLVNKYASITFRINK